MISFGRNVILLIVLVALVVSAILFLSRSTLSPSTQSDRLSVVASFFPLAEFARAVGGEFVDVRTITPNGIEPHEYEPTPEQVASVYKADVFLYNGNGVDAWAERISEDVQKKQIATLVLSTVGDSMIENPHIWLNPLLVQTFVQSIAAVYQAQDPTHAETYQKNANDFISDLQTLDQSYRDQLRDCQYRTVVVSHNAFTHLSLLYHFDIVSIAGSSPDEEPSAGRLAEIARFAKEKDVKFIFFETLASPKLSDTIAKEIGAKTLILNPLEGLSEEEQASDKNYLSIMKENLINLKIGMLCR